MDWARWVFLQLLAEFQNVIIDSSGRGIVLVSPYLIQEFVAANDTLWILYQKLKCLEFLGRQDYRLAVTFHFHLLEIGGDIGKADNLRFRHPGRMPQGSSHSGEQLPRAERFGHVVIRSEFKQ